MTGLISAAPCFPAIVTQFQAEVMLSFRGRLLLFFAAQRLQWLGRRVHRRALQCCHLQTEENNRHLHLQG